MKMSTLILKEGTNLTHVERVYGSFLERSIAVSRVVTSYTVASLTCERLRSARQSPAHK